MNSKLLIEQHLEFLSLKGGCTGWYESTLVKMPHCWKSHVTAQLLTSECMQQYIAMNWKGDYLKYQRFCLEHYLFLKTVI